MSRKTHGLSHTRTNHIWRQMRYRCSNQNDHQYHDYGGKGIKVCERWNKFENFLEDMGEAPEGLTIERKDGKLGYNKENCYWDTWEVQANNKSSNRPIAAFGEIWNIGQWSKIKGIPVSTIKNRLDRAGMTPEEALTPGKLSNANKTPKGERALRSDAEIVTLSTGQVGTRKELCKIHNVALSTVTSRMKAGMTFEQALKTSFPRGIHKNRRGGA
jgi:hypothetical protein